MKHDEATDVRLLSRIAKINQATKSIIVPATQVIGNKRWGRIDFLTHYCGYHLVRPDGTVMSNSPTAKKKRAEREGKRNGKHRNMSYEQAID